MIIAITYLEQLTVYRYMDLRLLRRK